MSRNVGDTAPPLQGQCWSRTAPSASTMVDLTGASSVTVNVQRPDGTVFNRAANIVPPSISGLWSLSPILLTDFPMAGTYRVDVTVTFLDTTTETFGPSFLSVKAGVAV